VPTKKSRSGTLPHPTNSGEVETSIDATEGLRLGRWRFSLHDSFTGVHESLFVEQKIGRAPGEANWITAHFQRHDGVLGGKTSRGLNQRC
jgi:hypothetical protein